MCPHPGVSLVTNRTVDQANIVADTAISGANEVSQAATEGVENVAASTGLLNQVGYRGNRLPVRGPFTWSLFLSTFFVSVQPPSPAEPPPRRSP